MPRIEQTSEFRAWLMELRDSAVKARIVRRVERLELGNRGDHRFLGDRLFELREHFGAGYRVYFTESEAGTIVLLVGGDKRSQAQDIRRARRIIATMRADS